MLEAGQVLYQRYQLKHKLGQNAGRQTWLAEDVATQPAEQVIVKLLAFGEQVNWEDLKLFEREADILKQLNHPQIPKYRDYFAIDDRILWFGLVYQYIPGSSLKELLAQRRKFTEKEIQNLAQNVLEILVYLHQISPTVLHRDIKPSNLILGEDKQIYLVDFGAVQDKAVTEGATFTVVGTYGYAPMEQFGGRAVPASDLYALGASLIHLLTGTAPADLPQKNMRIQFQDKVSLSPHFVSWIEQLTHPDVGKRFSTAREAIQGLRNKELKPKSQNNLVRVERPNYTQVKLFKSPNNLKIIIPNNYWMPHSEIYLGNRKGGFFSWLIDLIQTTIYSVMIMSVVISFTFIIVILLYYLVASSPYLAIIILILPIIICFFLKSRYTEINLTHEKYVIKEKFYLSTLSAVSGLISQTTNIRLFQHKKSSKSSIIIEFNSASKSWQDEFGKDLTDAEQQWLIYEIKNWINLNS